MRFPRGAAALLCVGLSTAVTPLGLPVRAASQQPTFRAAVDHVAVDVIATDSHDQPVTDLKQQDFQITERGRPQTIADFAYVSIPVVHRTIDRTDATAVPPIDVAENAQSSATSRVWVMIVDDLHILPQFIPQVKQVMTEFLQDLPSQDEVAITFVSRSDLSQNFTTDLAQLLKTVNNVKAAFGLGYGADAMSAASPLGARGIGSSCVAPQQVLQAAESAVFDVKNAATTLAGSDHARRAIVYVSGQSVLDLGADLRTCEHRAAVAYQGVLQDAFESARRADVPVYTLDPRGLAQPETATKGSCCTSSAYRAEIQRRILIQQDWLTSVATNTGGRAFINQNDLSRAIDEIVSDNSSYYLLGYYPDPFVRDGKFHDLKVTVTRPGVRVRARTGYVAPLAGAAPATPTATLAAVMASGFNVSGLPLQTFVAPIAPAPHGKVTVVVTTEVTFPPVGPGESSGDTLHWQVMALDPDGKVKSSVGNSAPITRSPTGSHVVVNDVLELPTQALTIRVAVTSEALRKSGSVQLLANVPDPSSGKLQVASIVLGLIGAGGTSASEPSTLKGLMPFQPTTTRAFSNTDTIQIFAPVFWSGQDGSAHAAVTIRQGTNSIVSHEATLQGAPMSDNHWTAAVRTDFPLASFAPGSYTLTVDIQQPDKPPVARAVSFDIKQ